MKMMFRTDASLQIGSGHVMRCLTFAEAMRNAGAQCYFICRAHLGNLIDEIRRRGFEVYVLPLQQDLLPSFDLSVNAPSSYTAWLGANWSTDAAQTKLGVGNEVVDWLVVDHYGLDTQWEREMRPLFRNLMVIDDLANRSHDCDVLLDQNLGRQTSDYSRLVPEDCIVLAGTQYTLLAPEFVLRRKDSLRRRETPKLESLLISMGGVDLKDATSKIMTVLRDMPLSDDMHITVVMGLHAPWLERVQSLAKQISQPIEVKINVNNMAQLMADSDLAIGGVGTASWERCCLGLPTLAIVLADNQRDIAAELERSGSVKLIKDVDAIDYSFRAKFDLIKKSEALGQLSQQSRLLVDGLGVGRVRRVIAGFQNGSTYDTR